jgi:hypothetical protein
MCYYPNFGVYEDEGGTWALKKSINLPDLKCVDVIEYYTATSSRIRIEAPLCFYMNVYKAPAVAPPVTPPQTQTNPCTVNGFAVESTVQNFYNNANCEMTGMISSSNCIGHPFEVIGDSTEWSGNIGYDGMSSNWIVSPGSITSYNYKLYIDGVQEGSSDVTCLGYLPDCGNNHIDDGEDCDGTDLDASCQYGGTIGCKADCTLDISGCNSPPLPSCGDLGGSCVSDSSLCGSCSGEATSDCSTCCCLDSGTPSPSLTCSELGGATCWDTFQCNDPNYGAGCVAETASDCSPDQCCCYGVG